MYRSRLTRFCSDSDVVFDPRLICIELDVKFVVRHVAHQNSVADAGARNSAVTVTPDAVDLLPDSVGVPQFQTAVGIWVEFQSDLVEEQLRGDGNPRQITDADTADEPDVPSSTLWAGFITIPLPAFSSCQRSLGYGSCKQQHPVCVDTTQPLCRRIARLRRGN